LCKKAYAKNPNFGRAEILQQRKLSLLEASAVITSEPKEEKLFRLHISFSSFFKTLNFI